MSLGHTDVMGRAWDFEDTAQKLAAYFEHQDQNRLDFVAGGHAAREWLRVMHSDSENDIDLARVRALIEGGTDDGSGWVELRVAFGQWLNSRAT